MRAFPLVFLVACMGNDAKGGADTAVFDAEADLDVGGLRIDISPPAGLGEPALLPQSHLVPGPEEGLEIELFPTVVWSGTLTGDVVRGWSGAAEVPTTEEPLEATLNASVSDTRLGGSVKSDEQGAFVLELPAYDEPYDVTIVPLDADLAPFHWEQRVFDADARRASENIDAGVPVYGRVTDATGAGVPFVPMRVVRTDLALGEVVSAVFQTDETGWYVARVEEGGTYSVEVIGGLTEDTARVVPTLRTDVVLDDPDAGAAVYVDLGHLNDASVSGYVEDEDGDAVAEAKVRLTSRSLDAYGSLVVEDVTGSEGRWGVDLLPGVWTLEAIPPFDRLVSGYTGEVVVDGGSDNVDIIELGPPEAIVGTLTGAPPGTTLQAKQLFGDHHVYPGTVGDDGRFELAVPEGEYLVSFEPPSGNFDGAITYETMRTGVETEVEMERGEPLSGHVAFGEIVVAYAVVRVYDRTTGVLVGRGITDDVGNFALLVPALDPGEVDTGE